MHSVYYPNLIRLTKKKGYKVDLYSWLYCNFTRATKTEKVGKVNPLHQC